MRMPVLICTLTLAALLSARAPAATSVGANLA